MDSVCISSGGGSGGGGGVCAVYCKVVASAAVFFAHGWYRMLRGLRVF